MLENIGAVDLARMQFAFTVAFHIIFPAISIGLASYLAVLEGLSLMTGRDIFMRLYRYWIKIFAVTFGMGVVSGLVMSYQFGTNWSVYADKTGPILGPLMGYEVLSAFFLEAGFLGVMLFGMNKVGKRLHFLATLMVAFGTAFSAFWILSVNSWMQTPAGYSINEMGQFVPEDWWAIVFNPSFPYRLVHMLLAAYLTTAFIVGGVGAFHLLRERGNEAARLMFSMAMWMAAIVAPIQMVVGDFHGINTLEHQPAKIAAMEGHFEPETSAPLLLFGIPDMEAGETRYKIGIPYLGSLILTHSLDGRVPGLNEFPPEDRPNATIVFFSFRIMVGIGILMATMGFISLYLRWKGRLYDVPLFHRVAVACGPIGIIAVLAGWVTTEVGRQPFTVYGLLRTSDSISPIAAPAVAGSLLAFVIVYFIVFGFGVLYLLRLMRRPPVLHEPDVDPDRPTRTGGSAQAQRVVKGSEPLPAE